MHKQWAHQSRELGRYGPRTVYGQTDSSRSLEDSVCVCVWGWLKTATHAGCWTRKIRDKLMQSAFCLLHAPLQHNKPATQALIRWPAHWQTYDNTRSPQAGKAASQGSPGPGLRSSTLECKYFSAAKLTRRKKKKRFLDMCFQRWDKKWGKTARPKYKCCFIIMYRSKASVKTACVDLFHK